MSSAADLKSAANRADSSGAQPIPPLILDPLPQKLVRLDPEGAFVWTAKTNELLKNHVDRMNAAITKLNESISELQKAVKP